VKKTEKSLKNFAFCFSWPAFRNAHSHLSLLLYPGSFHFSYTVSPTFADAVADMMNRAQPLCTGISSFVQHLGTAVEANPLFSSFVYRGPLSLRPFENTTRTGIEIYCNGCNTDLRFTTVYHFQIQLLTFFLQFPTF